MIKYKVQINLMGGLGMNVYLNSKELIHDERFIREPADKYGRDFQDSVQMQLKLKKVLPGVYGLDSYKIVKKLKLLVEILKVMW